jgi:hypothetical protein
MRGGWRRPVGRERKTGILTSVFIRQKDADPGIAEAEDGLVYWTMGAPIEETTIINRCPKEGTYEYRLKMGTLPENKKK